MGCQHESYGGTAMTAIVSEVNMKMRRYRGVEFTCKDSEYGDLRTHSSYQTYLDVEIRN